MFSIADLTKYLQANAIDFFALDALPFSEDSSFSSSRRNSDIPFYVFSKDRERALVLLKSQAQIVEEHIGKYCKFVIDGISCNLCYQTAKFASNSKQHYWDELIDSYFDDILDHVEVSGVQVPILPATINSINKFVRLYNLYRDGNIRLDQLIDWMNFFEERHEEIIAQELIAKLDKLGLRQQYMIFGVYLIRELKMDASHFPKIISSVSEKDVSKVTRSIKKGSSN